MLMLPLPPHLKNEAEVDVGENPSSFESSRGGVLLRVSAVADGEPHPFPQLLPPLLPVLRSLPPKPGVGFGTGRYRFPFARPPMS